MVPFLDEFYPYGAEISGKLILIIDPNLRKQTARNI